MNTKKYFIVFGFSILFFCNSYAADTSLADQMLGTYRGNLVQYGVLKGRNSYGDHVFKNAEISFERTKREKGDKIKVELSVWDEHGEALDVCDFTVHSIAESQFTSLLSNKKMKHPMKDHEFWIGFQRDSQNVFTPFIDSVAVGTELVYQLKLIDNNLSSLRIQWLKASDRSLGASIEMNNFVKIAAKTDWNF
jgi:hypothetical protein